MANRNGPVPKVAATGPMLLLLSAVAGLVICLFLGAERAALVANVIAVAGAIIVIWPRLIDFVGQEKRRAGVATSPDGTRGVLDVDPYAAAAAVLVFRAVFAAGMGGLLWAALNRINDRSEFMGPSPYVGGEFEPHGEAVIIWAVATNVSVALMVLSTIRKYWGRDGPDLWRVGGLFMVGGVVGALGFYDLPILGWSSRGVRIWVGSRTTLESVQRELLLAVAWAFSIALWALFLPAAIGSTRARVAKLKSALIGVGGTVLVVVLVVGLFLLGFPITEEAAFGRGLVAGVALRTSLGLGILLVALHAE